MSEKEPMHDDTSTPVPETPVRLFHASDEAGRRPDQCLGRQMDLFRQSLAAEGEEAYQRWGMPLFHSLTDEEAETQRAAFGVELKDALDFYNRGCLMVTREDYAGAAKAFAHAAQLNPALAEAIFNRALALEKTGNLAAAREAWQAYLQNFGEEENAVDVKQHLEGLAQA